MERIDTSNSCWLLVTVPSVICQGPVSIYLMLKNIDLQAICQQLVEADH